MSDSECLKCHGTAYTKKEMLEDGSCIFTCCDCFIDAKKFKELCQQLQDEEKEC